MDLIEELKSQYREEEGSFGRARRSAWSRFLHLGLPPQIKLTVSKKTDLPVVTETKKNRIVFANGVFQKNVSDTPSNITVLSLREAFRTFGPLLEDYFAGSDSQENDALTALNGALFEEGVFLYVPPKCSVEGPIEILHLESGDGLFFPRMVVILGKGSTLNLVVSYEGQGNFFRAGRVDLFLEERSSCKIKNRDYGQGNLQRSEAVRATLKNGAVFNQTLFMKGGRRNFVVKLAGEKASVTLQGALLLEGKNETAVDVVMHHQKAHTHSMQRFKAVLNDRSRFHFRGKIRIDQDAQKVEAYQLNHNLLLSDLAHVTTEPNLEIFADDVKASHGATAGTIDEEALFYLKTRGIPHAFAKEILIKAFLEEITSSL